MKFSKIFTCGILFAAFLIIYEKYVIVSWRYTPTDPTQVPQKKLDTSFTSLIDGNGALAGEGWNFNHPPVINNNKDWAWTQRDMNLLMM